VRKTGRSLSVPREGSESSDADGAVFSGVLFESVVRRLLPGRAALQGGGSSGVFEVRGRRRGSWNSQPAGLGLASEPGSQREVC
jgi:hypothetical protein